MGNEDFWAESPSQPSTAVAGSALVVHNLSNGRGLDASFTVEAQEFVTVVADPSVSRNLFDCLAGFDPECGGFLTLGNENVDSVPLGQKADFRRRNIGLIFPTRNLIPTMDAAQNVAFTAATLGLHPPAERIDFLLELGGVDAAASPQQLNGTDALLLASARALAFAPPIVIANHVTDTLGEEEARRVTSYIKEAAYALGVAVLFLTGHEGLAEGADRTLYLDGGNVVSMVVPPAPSAFEDEDNGFLLASALDQIAPAKQLSEEQQAVLQRAKDILDSLPGSVIDEDR